MSNDQINIDQLFQKASVIETQVSFEETKKAFMTTILLSAGGVLASKGVLKLLTTKKWLIMMSAITTVTTASIIGVMSLTPTVEEGSVIEINAPNPNFTTKELVLLLPEEKNNAEQDLIVEEIPEYNESIEIIESDDFTDIGDFSIYKELFNDDTIKVNENGNFEKEEIKPYSQRFEITHKTTMDDLEQMKIAAEEAGIKFSYKAKIKQNQLKSIALHTEIKQKGNKQSMSITSTDFDQDDEPMVFGWYEDGKGTATEMGFGDEANIKCATGSNVYIGGNKHSHHEHHDDYEYAYAYNSSMFDCLDSLDVDISEDMEDLLETLEVELEILEEQIEGRVETIDLSGVQSVLQEVNAESRILFQAIQTELNTIFQEIEEKDREKKVEQ